MCESYSFCDCRNTKNMSYKDYTDLISPSIFRSMKNRGQYDVGPLNAKKENCSISLQFKYKTIKLTAVTLITQMLL